MAWVTARRSHGCSRQQARCDSPGRQQIRVLRQPEPRRLGFVRPQSPLEFGAPVEQALRQRLVLTDALQRGRDSSLQLPKRGRIGRRHRVQFCAQLRFGVGGHRKRPCQHLLRGAFARLRRVLYGIAQCIETSGRFGDGLGPIGLKSSQFRYCGDAALDLVGCQRQRVGCRYCQQVGDLLRNRGSGCVDLLQ